MSDQSGHFDACVGPDPAPVNADEHLVDTPLVAGRQSIQQRLDALAQSIRTWDWRTQVVGDAPTRQEKPRPTVADAPAAATATTTPVESPGQSRDSPSGTIQWDKVKPRQWAPSVPPSEPESQPVPAPAQNVAASHPAAPARQGAALWPWLIVAIAAAVFVTVVVALSLRSTPKPPATSHGSTTTQVAGSAHSVVAGKFISVATGMNAANVQLKAQLATASGSSTVAQVTAEVTPYLSALKDYDYEVHFLPWPAAMATASQNLYVQLEAYATLLASITSVNPATLNSYLSEVRARAGTTEAADNAVRNGLGLPSSYLFP